ncbi:MAG: hypothetical protein JZU70_09595 [Chlorobium sp.]|jgi:hypothetical protein|nr:hypothetical protein [Chlorobium sp.]
MTQKAQSTPAAVALNDVEIPCDIFGSDTFYNYFNYTENLFYALIMALTAEDTKTHTLALLISSRFERIKKVLDDQYTASISTD